MSTKKSCLFCAVMLMSLMNYTLIKDTSRPPFFDGLCLVGVDVLNWFVICFTMMKCSILALLAAAVTHSNVSAFQTPQTHIISRPIHHDVAISPSPITSNTFYTSTSIISTTKQQQSTALYGIPKMFRWLTDQYPNILNRRLGSVSYTHLTLPTILRV